MKKKLVSLILAAVMLLAVTAEVNVFAFDIVSATGTAMYSADGRVIYVIPSEVELYKAVGWYTEPPVVMYAADGRTLYVIPSEVELYKAVGWYTEPPVLMYAADGRTLYVIPSEVELYRAVGWYSSLAEAQYANRLKTHDEMVAAYKNALSNHGFDTMSWKTSAGEVKTIMIYSEYAVYDIDKDSVPELLVNDANDDMLYIYKYENNKVICWNGYVDVYNSQSFYEYPNGNGIIMYGGGQGKYSIEYLTRYIYSDNQLVDIEVIAETETGTIENLNQILSRYKGITFLSVNDLSLLYSI